jgi:hypothetical protein
MIHNNNKFRGGTNVPLELVLLLREYPTGRSEALPCHRRTAGPQKAPWYDGGSSCVTMNRLLREPPTGDSEVELTFLSSWCCCCVSTPLGALKPFLATAALLVPRSRLITHWSSSCTLLLLCGHPGTMVAAGNGSTRAKLPSPSGAARPLRCCPGHYSRATISLLVPHVRK